MKNAFAVLMGVLFLAGTSVGMAEEPKPVHPLQHKLKKDIKYYKKGIKEDKQLIKSDKKEIKNDKLQEKVDNAAASQELAGGNDKAAIKYEKAALKEQKDIKATKWNKNENAKLEKLNKHNLKYDEKKLRKVDNKIKEDKSTQAAVTDQWNGHLADPSVGTATGK